ncbi:MAG: helix-turn-helix domain-containing protein [Candidatus Woesearchaeota archaeon]
MELADLKKIGLTEGEIKIYEALLDIGETTRTQLAKKSGISPSKIYDVANRLLEKGIISSVKKNGVIHFSAADPERLIDFLEQKENEIKKEKNIVNKLLPTLMAKYREVEDDTDVEVFYGWEGMKTVYSDIAKSLGPKDINYIFGASIGKDWKQADIFFKWYRRISEDKGYKIKIIFNEDVRGHEARTDYWENTPRHEARYLHQETFTELNFYKDVVLFVMLFKKPIIVRVKNKEAADSFKKFFETMWWQAKP